MSLDVAVGESLIQGKGVFAARDFTEGEVVIRWDTKQTLTEIQIQNLPENQKKYLSYVGNGNYILLQEPEKYVNHSCNPNTNAKDCCDIAIRAIKTGEEITADYTLEGVRFLVMDCNCGSDKCRGIVYGDFNKLDPKTQKGLEPFRQEWHRKEFSGHHEAN